MHGTFLKLVTFGFVGALGTGIHYLTLILLVEIINTDPVIATTLGFLAGAIINYDFNYRYTFKSTKNHIEAGPKFFLIAFFTGILNTLLVHIGVHEAGINYILVQVLSTLIVFFVNFLLNSIWTFRESDT